MPQLFYHYTSAGALVNKHYALCHRWATNTTGNDCRHRSGAATSQLAQATSQVFQLNGASQAVQLGIGRLGTSQVVQPTLRSQLENLTRRHHNSPAPPACHQELEQANKHQKHHGNIFYVCSQSITIKHNHQRPAMQ